MSGSVGTGYNGKRLQGGRFFPFPRFGLLISSAGGLVVPFLINPLLTTALSSIPPSLHALVPGVVTSNSPATPSVLVWSGSVSFLFASFLFFSVHVCVYWVMIQKKRELNSRLWNGTLKGESHST